jgi:hypothetical protein
MKINKWELLEKSVYVVLAILIFIYGVPLDESEEVSSEIGTFVSNSRLLNNISETKLLKYVSESKLFNYISKKKLLKYVAKLKSLNFFSK